MSPSNATTFNLFNLPKIHNLVPKSASLTPDDSSLSECVRKLIAGGIINLRSIQRSARTPSAILSQGLSKWFADRTSAITHINFDVSIVDTQVIKNHLYFEQFQEQGPQYLMMVCDNEQFYRFKPASVHLEAACPGLTAATIHAIEQASYLTVDVRTSNELFETFSQWYWEGDSTASDTEVREILEDRFGGDSTEIDEHLPTRAREIFGIPVTGRWKNGISEKNLYSVAHTPSDSFAKRVAAEVLKLKELTTQCEQAKAQFPKIYGHCDNLCAETIFRGCCLIYDWHDHITTIYDAQVNDLYNSGEGTDILGFATLPINPQELVQFF
jgi:PRTRC genetic system protein F